MNQVYSAERTGADYHDHTAQQRQEWDESSDGAGPKRRATAKPPFGAGCQSEGWIKLVLSSRVMSGSVA